MKSSGLMFLIMLFIANICWAQTRVLFMDSIANVVLPEVTIMSATDSKIIGKSNQKGEFIIPTGLQNKIFTFSHVNYISKDMYIEKGEKFIDVYLKTDSQAIDEVVVSTGYSTIPKERATGSFENISSASLHRVPMPNILQKLEGQAPGIQFVNSGGSKANDIRVRGLGTIESDSSPLIILDNFPYDGDLSTIDPNNIESVTILKDAAAASIWGARAGNGVIVLKSKNISTSSKVQIQALYNHSIQDRPNFKYNKAWLPAETVMLIEKDNYLNNVYSFDNTTSNPMYVELLNNYKNNSIDLETFEKIENMYKNTDGRQQIRDNLYRPAQNQQLGFYTQGSSGAFNFRTAVGYNRNISEQHGDDQNRFNLSLFSSVRLSDRINMSLALGHVEQQAHNNGLGFADFNVPTAGGVSSYLPLSYEGRSLAFPRGGISSTYTSSAVNNNLLDWEYRPLDEISLRRNRSWMNETKINMDLNFSILKSLTIQAAYQYIKSGSRGENHYLKDSYYVRDMVNRFTQADGSRIIPYEGIMIYNNPNSSNTHYGRLKLDYNTTFSFGSLNSLVGMDIRESSIERLPGSILYNYNEDSQVGTNRFNFNQNYPVKPLGSSRIPNSSIVHNLYRNRDLSYYFNGGFDYKDQLLLSTSLRWDGSNLFGVKANQKGVPLWSIGTGWLIHNAPFYRSSNLNYLKLRLTYGVSGNVNKQISHYPTIQYGTNLFGTTVTSVRSVGNPSLSWERVAMSNIGLDGKFSKYGLDFSIEAYHKKGSNLIGSDYMDPTTGVIGEYKINYADITTKGVDFRINQVVNLFKNVRFKSTLNLSFVSNQIDNYNTNSQVGSNNYLQDAPPPLKGRSKDVVYALPVSGLNSENGLPLIYIDGLLSDKYATYINSIIPTSDLEVVGNSIPVRYASWIPTIQIGNFSLSAMISYKGGYVFRRNSMSPIGETNANYHMDYFKRWQNPGDELITNVARKIEINEIDPELRAGSYVYTYTRDLITPADHIRLQDLNLSWKLPIPHSIAKKVNSIFLSAFGRNLGIIWRKNNQGIDPDFAFSQYRNPAMGGVSLTLQF